MTTDIRLEVDASVTMYSIDAVQVCGVMDLGASVLTTVSSDLKPLSQLAHEHFTTLCDRNFLASYELSHTLHDVWLSLHAF